MHEHDLRKLRKLINPSITSELRKKNGKFFLLFFLCSILCEANFADVQYTDNGVEIAVDGKSENENGNGNKVVKELTTKEKIIDRPRKNLPDKIENRPSNK